jgi:hypothetical protein
MRFENPMISGLVEQAALGIFPTRLVSIFAEILVRQVAKLLLIDADRGGRDLLVVADNHHLRREILQERGFQTRLRGLVDHDQVEHVRCDPELLSDPVDRHDPYGNRGATAIHRSANLGAPPVSVLPGAAAEAPHELRVLVQVGLSPARQPLGRHRMRPGSHGRQPLDLAAKLFLDHRGLGLQGVDVRDVLAQQPVTGRRPIPRCPELAEASRPVTVRRSTQDGFI